MQFKETNPFAIEILMLVTTPTLHGTFAMGFKCINAKTLLR